MYGGSYGRKGRNFRIDAKRPAKIGRLTQSLGKIEYTIHSSTAHTIAFNDDAMAKPAAMLRSCSYRPGTVYNCLELWGPMQLLHLTPTALIVPLSALDAWG